MKTIAELRTYLTDLAKVVAIICMLVACGAIVSIAVDFRAIRSNSIQSAEQLRIGLFTRADSWLWRVDDSIVILKTLESRLDSQLTRVRAQVKEASDDATHETKALTKATTTAVQQSLETATAAINAVADKDVQVKVETPKPVIAPTPPVILRPAPPVVVAPLKPKPAEKPAEASGFWRRVSRILWPFKKQKPAE
jgi:hypothetical protein